MKVNITAVARTEVFAIQDWIAQDNPWRAESFGQELVEKCLAIGLNHRLYPLARNLETQDIRRRLHKGYLIFYRVGGDSIDILHILHGARDYIALIGEGDPHTKE